MSGMNGMTTGDRYKDISERSGLSEDIVRRVLSAETESILESLKKGERATLIGRCTLRPDIRSKIEVGGKRVKYIRARATPSSIIQNELGQLSEYEVDELDREEDMEGIAVRQIQSLI